MIHVSPDIEATGAADPHSAGGALAPRVRLGAGGDAGAIPDERISFAPHSAGLPVHEFAGGGWLGPAAALLGHTLLLGGFLMFADAAGSPHQVAESVIEVELVAVPPGGAALAQQLPPVEAESEPALIVASGIASQADTEVARPDPQAAQAQPASMDIVASITPLEDHRAAAPSPGPEEAIVAPLLPAPTSPAPPVAAPASPVKQHAAAKPAPEPAKRKPPQQRGAREKNTTTVQRTPPAAAMRGEERGRIALAGQGGMSADAFKAAVAARIARNKPSSDVAAAAQGVVLVTFRIASSGAAEAVSVARSSGHAVLDQAAVGAVRRASPFPPPPHSAPRSFTVPMRFNAQ